MSSWGLKTRLILWQYSPALKWVTYLYIARQQSLSLVYGGSKVDLMGTLADRMLDNGAPVIGVIPQTLVDVEIAHHGLSKLHIVNSMNERKERIAALADGFITMPDGAGSLDEFFEMLTLGQLGYHAKPSSIFNVGGYYDHLLKFLDNAVGNGFINKVHQQMVIVDDSAAGLLKQIYNYLPPTEKSWDNTSETNPTPVATL